jgi:hypothetical protein
VKLIEGIGKGSSDFDNRFANQSAKGAFKVPSGLGLVVRASDQQCHFLRPQAYGAARPVAGNTTA